MSKQPNVQDSDSELRFPSAASLRSAHEDLVRRRRSEGDTSGVIAEIHLFIEHGCQTGRLLDDEGERRSSQAMLDYWSNALIRLDQDPGDATLYEFDPSLAPELPDELCPYVGLDAFSENNTSQFFGRQRLVQTLVEKIAEERLLVVSGPSGSGKSSVVLAGLIPSLKNGMISDSEDWRYIPRMVPGSNPLANLARLLWTLGGDQETDRETWIEEQVALLRNDSRHLVRLANETGAQPIVGVIDQFEEVFSLCNNESARRAFVTNLLHLVQDPGSRHNVILTMRTDFESYMVVVPGLQNAFERAVVRVTPMDPAELREAIERPADQVGLKYESGLVSALLHDILGEPAALPLLQFTLLKLWDNRQRNLITWEAYKRLGGGRLALANSANAFYDGLIPEDKVTAQRILLRLVRPTEGLEVTSNRVRLETLLQIGEARDRLKRVLEKLFEARLLRVTEGDVASDTQVEVAHEALIRNWPLLVEWLDAERDRMRKRMRLTAAAEQWNSLGRTNDALWRGALLDEARHHHDLNDLEKEFVEASLQSQTEAALAAERARQLEIEQAIALAEAERLQAEEQRKAASRYRRLTAAFAVMSTFALVAALIALVLLMKADVQRKKAIAAQVTAEARREDAQRFLSGWDSQASELQTAQAMNAVQAILIQTLEASSGATSILTSPPIPSPTATVGALPTPNTGIATETLLAVVTRTPTRTATPSPTSQLSLRLPPQTPAATATAAALATLRSQLKATQTAIAFGNPIQRSESGQIVFTCHIDGRDQICILDSDGSDLRQLTDVQATNLYPSLSNDGNSIVFSSSRENPEEGLFLIFQMNTDGSNQRILASLTGQLFAPELSPDGTRIVFTRAIPGSQNIWVMNIDGTDELAITSTTNNNLDPVWSPDGTQIAFASDRTGKWEHYLVNADGSNLRVLSTGVDEIGGRSDWSPDGKWLAFYAGPQGNRNVFLVATDGSGVVRQLTNGGDNTAPSFSPLGDRIAFSSYRDGDLEIFTMDIDGANITQITSNTRPDWQPRWGPKR